MGELHRQLCVIGPAGRLVGRLFDAVDENQSGFVEEEEGRVFLGVAGCSESELGYYWTDLLRAADQNGDGKICKSEFLAYVLGEEELDEHGHFSVVSRAEEISARTLALRKVSESMERMRREHESAVEDLKFRLAAEAKQKAEDNLLMFTAATRIQSQFRRKKWRNDAKVMVQANSLRQ